MAAIGPHHMNLEHVFFQAVGPVGDPLAVGREEGTTVVARLVGQLPHSGAIGIHHIDVGIAVAIADKQNLPAVGGEGAFGVVAGSVGELLKAAAVGARGKNIHVGIEVPLITPPAAGAGVFGCLRAGVGFCLLKVWIGVARSEEEPRAVRGEKTAGGSAAAVADADRRRDPRRRARKGLGVDLIEGIALRHALVADLP